MGVPNEIKQYQSDNLTPLAKYLAVFTDSAGTTGANEAVGGGYAREEIPEWTPTGTGTNNAPQLQVFLAADTYVEGGFFSTETGLTVDAPTGLGASAQGTGGTFATGTYYWTVTATNWAGETLESSEVSASLTGPTASASLSWTNPEGSMGTKVYRGTTSGNENVLVATLGEGVSSVTDTGAAGTAATPPVSNTAKSFVFSNVFGGGEIQVFGVGGSLFIDSSITV